MNHLKEESDELTLELSEVSFADMQKAADAFHDVILPRMDAIRSNADALEQICGREFWPIPSYLELLFGVD